MAFDINFLADQLGHVRQDRVPPVGPLDDDLRRLPFQSAVKRFFLQFIFDLDRVGYHVRLSVLKHFHQANAVFRHLDIQFQALRFGKVPDQVILVSHRFGLVLEVGGGTVQSNRRNFSFRLYLRQVYLFLLLLGSASQKK